MAIALVKGRRAVSILCGRDKAGVMAWPESRTEDGSDGHFATKHVGNFLRTSLIMPKYLAADLTARVVWSR